MDLSFDAANSKFINWWCTTASAMESSLVTALNAEAEGCLTIETDGMIRCRPGPGPQYLTQNSTGTKLIKDNISFLAYDYGFHPYTASNSITGYLITRISHLTTG
jgi:hypothetical protein